MEGNEKINLDLNSITSIKVDGQVELAYFNSFDMYHD